VFIISDALDIEGGDAECLNNVVLNGLTGVGTKAANTLVGVGTAQCRQIHARDGAKEPRNLPIFFHGAPRDERCGAALNGAGIYADALDPIEVQRGAAIGLEGTASQGGDGAGRVGDGGAMAVNDIEARRIIATHTAAPGRMPKRNGVEGKRITL